MQIKRITQLLLIAVMVLSACGFASPQGEALARVQPQLRELAAANPDGMVRVIAQKMAGAKGVENLVAKLGGQVVSDLSIINAFAAEIPAEGALELARSDSVRWVSLDAPTKSTGKPPKDSDSTSSTDPENTYLDTLDVRDLWNMGLTGAGVGVAIIDSGISVDQDWTNSLRTFTFATNSRSSNDVYGHGTHVAGIIAGNGSASNGFYTGIAPDATLYAIKIADGDGMAYESDVVAGLQWVYDNHVAYNIRVVNVSLNTTVAQSYHESPLDAAVEILWFNGVVVVASAGNYGSDGAFNPVTASPANDPFIITVGAIDEKGTTRTRDDNWADFSAIGNTTDGFAKPEIHAPGRDIVSILSKDSPWDAQYPDRVTSDGEYIRLSGTSMSAPMVTGVVALLLQDEPELTPDQVKYRLLNTFYWAGTVKSLDGYGAVTGTTTESANQGLFPSQLLSTGDDPIAWGSVGWNSVGWNSVGWNSVGWNSVGWNSVGWNSVGWNSTFWGE